MGDPYAIPSRLRLCTDPKMGDVIDLVVSRHVTRLIEAPTRLKRLYTCLVVETLT